MKNFSERRIGNESLYTILQKTDNLELAKKVDKELKEKKLTYTSFDLISVENGVLKLDFINENKADLIIYSSGVELNNLRQDVNSNEAIQSVTNNENLNGIPRMKVMPGWNESATFFKSIAYGLGKTPSELLSYIHKNKMHVNQNEYMSFGRKTANYLPIFYKQLDVNQISGLSNRLRLKEFNELSKAKNNYTSISKNRLIGRMNHSKNPNKNQIIQSINKMPGNNIKLYSRELFGKSDLSIVGKLGSNKSWYGHHKGSENIKDTLIAKGLSSQENVNFIKNRIHKLKGIIQGNHGYYVKNLDGSLGFYSFDKNGKLELACYSSPGSKYKRNMDGSFKKSKNGKKIINKGGNYTPKGTYKLGKTEVSHVSNSGNGIVYNKEAKSFGGWGMINASRFYTLNGGYTPYFVHDSNKSSGKPASHGCERISGLYAEGLKEIRKRHGIIVHVLDNYA